MKITRILPRKIAKACQEHDLRRIDGFLEYHKSMVRLYESLLLEGHAEFERLKEKKDDERA